MPRQQFSSGCKRKTRGLLHAVVDCFIVSSWIGIVIIVKPRLDLQVHADILPAALESMSGPAKKAAADLLGKVPSAAANGHATAAAANPQQPSTQAFEPPTSKPDTPQHSN